MVSEIKNTVLRSVVPGAKIIVLDVETTGLNASTCNVIQFAGIKMTVNDDYSFTENDSINLYVKQDAPLPEKIVELTGITDAMLASGLSEDESAETINDFIEDGEILVAHNASFDDRFVSMLLERHGFWHNMTVIDTVAMAKDLIKKSEADNFKLISLAKKLKIKNDTFHSADSDTYVCKAIFIKLFETYRTEAQELKQNLARPKVWKIKFWEGFRGLTRVYVFTNNGTFYFDNKYQQWDVKKDDRNIDIRTIDMEWLRTQVLLATECVDEAELRKWRGEIAC